jgi:hypothetical protein
MIPSLESRLLIPCSAGEKPRFSFSVYANPLVAALNVFLALGLWLLSRENQRDEKLFPGGSHD